MYILFLLLLLNLQSLVYATIEQGRKHSTAHYFKNGTLIIIGGIEPSLSTTTNNLQFASPIVTLLFNPKNFSLTSTKTDATSLVQLINGHTSHYNSSSDSLFSVFGICPNHQYAPLIQLYSSSVYQNQTKQNLIGRQYHTSAYINSTLYVLGGYHNKDQQEIQASESLIIYSNKTSRTVSFPSVSGHSTVVYQYWLISCFGHQKEYLNNHCIWFDTRDLSVTNVSSTILEWPTARTYASMISIKNGSYLLFGGERKENEILDDIWKLVITKPFDMTWEKMGVNTKGKSRSGHVGVLLSNDTVLYYGGGGVEVDEPLFFNVTSMNWIEAHNKRNSILTRRAEGNSLLSPSSSSLSGGAIAGIVIGIIVFLGALYLFWKRYSRKTATTPSRATRFQPQIPLQSPIIKEIAPPVEQQQQEVQKQQEVKKQQFVLSLPEVALSSDSRLSLGPNFSYLAETNKSQTSFQSDIISKERTSSVFPARKSYLQPPPTPRTPDSLFHNSPRGSLSAKSVSSVQWVGFNDNMDYSVNDMHLSVANRASNYYSDTSAQTTPRSPMFPSHLRDNYENSWSNGNKVGSR